MAKPTATAASIALPPFLSTSTPIRAAIASCATTMPFAAVTSGVFARRHLFAARAKRQRDEADERERRELSEPMLFHQQIRHEQVREGKRWHPRTPLCPAKRGEGRAREGADPLGAELRAAQGSLKRPPHPRFARPLPARSGGTDEQLSVPATPIAPEFAYLVIARSEATKQSSGAMTASFVVQRNETTALDCFASLAMTTKEKREAERRQTCVQPPHLAKRRAPFSFPSPACGGGLGGGTLACRRSTAALASASERQRSAPGQASWDLAGRSILYGSLQPGSEDLALLNGRYPRPPVPVQGTHLPDRS